MKKFRYFKLLVLLNFCTVVAIGQCTLNTQMLGEPTFEDNFNYSSLGEMESAGKWLFQYRWGKTLPQYDNIFEKEQISFPGDGTIVLNSQSVTPFVYCNPDNPGCDDEYTHKSALIRMNKLAPDVGVIGCPDTGIMYGVIEMRCKLPAPTAYSTSDQHAWPAFWLHFKSEIDIFEHHTNSSDYWTNNNHWLDAMDVEHGCENRYLKQGQSLYDDFHTFTCIWMPPIGTDAAKVIFFIDGKELRTIDENVYTECPMDVIIELAISRNVVEHSVESNLIIDYFKYWSLDVSDYTNIKSEIDFFQQSLDPTYNSAYNAEDTYNSIVVNSVGDQIFYRGVNDKIQYYKWNPTLAWWDHYFVRSAGSSSENVTTDISLGLENEIFFRGQDEELHRVYYDDVDWQHEVISNSFPSMFHVSNEYGSIEGFQANVFVRTVNNRIARIWKSGGVWSAELLTPASAETLINGPMKAFDGTNLYYRGADGYIQKYYFDGVAWQHQYVDFMGSNLRVKNCNDCIDTKDNLVAFVRNGISGLANNKVHIINTVGGTMNYVAKSPIVKSDIEFYDENNLFYISIDNELVRLYKEGLAWKFQIVNPNLYFSPEEKFAFAVSTDASMTIYHSSIDANVTQIFSQYCENLNPTCDDSTPTGIYKEYLQAEQYTISVSGRFINLHNFPDNNLDQFSIEIFNSLGQMVYACKTSSDSFELADFKNGIYLLIVTQGNSLLASQRIGVFN